MESETKGSCTGKLWYSQNIQGRKNNQALKLHGSIAGTHSTLNESERPVLLPQFSLSDSESHANHQSTPETDSLPSVDSSLVKEGLSQHLSSTCPTPSKESEDERAGVGAG